MWQKSVNHSVYILFRCARHYNFDFQFFMYFSYRFHVQAPLFDHRRAKTPRSTCIFQLYSFQLTLKHHFCVGWTWASTKHTHMATDYAQVFGEPFHPISNTNRTSFVRHSRWIIFTIWTLWVVSISSPPMWWYNFEAKNKEFTEAELAVYFQQCRNVAFEHYFFFFVFPFVAVETNEMRITKSFAHKIQFYRRVKLLSHN